MDCPLQVGSEGPPLVGEFKYLKVLFRNEVRMEREIVRKNRSSFYSAVDANSNFRSFLQIFPTWN